MRRITPNDKFSPEKSMGLVRKYIVRKADTGEEVEDCFVLRPRKDWAARYAVRAYADMTCSTKLREDLLKWVGEEFPVSSYEPKYARIDQSKFQLKPCPRCGSKGLIIYEGPKYYYAECESCPLELHEIYFSAESAAEAWNYREEKPNDPLTLDELRKMDKEPVWGVFSDGPDCYMIIKWHNSEFFNTFECGFLLVDEYGKSWLAYRRKPEEEV